MIKKIIALLISFALLFTSFGIYNSFAEETDTINKLNVYKTNTAPNIDGDLNEACWNINTPISKVFYNNVDSNNSAKFGVIYDDNYLYVGVKINDNKVVEGNMFDTDDVEIYIDGKNDRSTSYGFDDIQVALPYTNSNVKQPADFGCCVIKDGKNINDIKRACKKTDTGWDEEVAIPWSMIGVESSKINDIGFDIMVSDSDKDGGGCQNYLFWNMGAPNEWKDTTGFGELILIHPDDIATTGIKLDEHNLDLNVGNKKQLVATVSPNNATNKKVTWSSSNSCVATVDTSGNIMAIKAGNAVITAETAYGKFNDKCSVTVHDDSDDNDNNLFIKETTSKIKYSIGENAVFNISVTNKSNSPMKNIKIDGAVPEGLKYVSDDSNGSYNSENGIWMIDKIPENSTVQLNITMKILKSGQIDNVVNADIDGLIDPVEDCASIYIDDVPKVKDYNVTTNENKAVSGKIISSNENNDKLQYFLDSSHSGANVVVNNDGTWVYTPNKDYYGDDSFTVKVDDGEGGTAVSTVYVKINKCSDDKAPATNDSSLVTDKNNKLNGKVNINNPDKDNLIYTIEKDPLHGSVTLNKDGTWIYTPNKDYCGNDSFVIKIQDSNGMISTSIINVKINNKKNQQIQNNNQKLPISNNNTKKTNIVKTGSLIDSRIIMIIGGILIIIGFIFIIKNKKILKKK